MPTIKLTPSTYSRSNTSYVTVTNASNMYDDASDTSNYSTIRGRQGRSTNNTYYLFLHGFDFTQIPAGSTINSFTIRIRCFRNQYQNVGDAYRIRLAGSPTSGGILSGTTTSQDINTYASVLTIPTGAYPWDDIEYWGTNFSICIPLRNTSSNSSRYPYVYVYGAEIEVDYTEPPTPPEPPGDDEDDEYYYIMFMQRLTNGI